MTDEIVVVETQSTQVYRVRLADLIEAHPTIGVMEKGSRAWEDAVREIWWRDNDDLFDDCGAAPIEPEISLRKEAT